ncbi:MAG: nucleotidyltransferase [Acidobacteria bacterium]|nr:nucleotidyltransferase [Acidobacteriota bacterium]
MAESPHYKELLLILNESGVEYLIVGGYAVMKYSEPRYTKDLAVWVRNSRENSARLYHALARFGAPLAQAGVTPGTFTKDKIVYQIGVAPVRIDITTHIDGVTFETAWQNRVQSAIFGVPVHFLSLGDLITNKQSTGRSADLEFLKQMRRAAKEKPRP